ncbi:cysteine dioxygenase [Acidovorax sp. SUPP2522]|uniref:cysteine dioxygenase family protein n=1 Tax=unclassified Acidovorax TaxID=2684926 RepID=UPI002349E1E3|nr:MULTISPECIES: cysteine dioxygenase [unclassified Acidovorax]WCM99818.1 cysteine dioxygenase [Acidovorax sp. GBBC 1281]GKT14801.1 cysteine dioxygenase [Acidovorax sp. SUPP2522]
MPTASSPTAPVNNPPNTARLRHFVQQIAALLEPRPAEPDILARGSALLADLVSHDDWLPPEYAQPDPERYQQYLLHADALGRFSVVSFVWGPGQATPIHDHTVWGLVGMLRGAELSQAYGQDGDGRWQPRGAPHRLQPGDTEAVSPTIGDVHRVSNALAVETSISIHVYGANIGAVQRSVYREDGSVRPFVSGYSNATLPNLWNQPLAGPASHTAPSACAAP